MIESLAGLVSSLRNRAGGRPDLLSFHGEAGSPRESISTVDLLARTHTMVLALRHGGVAAGDRIALAGCRRPERWFLELAAQCVGAITVPLPSDVSTEDLGFVLRNAGPRWIFHGGPEAEAIHALAETLRRPPRLVAFDAVDHRGEGPPLTRLLGAHESERANMPLDRVWAPGGPDDIATIFYTFGADRPTGLAASHRGLLTQARALGTHLGLSEADIVASSLRFEDPVARALELACLLYGASVRMPAGPDGEGFDPTTFGQLRPTIAALREQDVESLVSPADAAVDPRGRIRAASGSGPSRSRAGRRGRWWSETRGRASRTSNLGDLRAVLVGVPPEREPRRGVENRWPWVATRAGSGALLAISEIPGTASSLTPLDGVELTSVEGRLMARGPAIPAFRWDQPPVDLRDADGWLDSGLLGGVDDAGYWTIDA